MTSSGTRKSHATAQVAGALLRHDVTISGYMQARYAEHDVHYSRVGPRNLVRPRKLQLPLSAPSAWLDERWPGELRCEAYKGQ